MSTRHWVVFSVAGAMMLLADRASSETLAGALARAYALSPILNSERAAARGIDEEVPRALAGFRPKVNAEAFIGLESRRYSGFDAAGQGGVLRPRSLGATVEQPLFDGLRTRNSVRAAEGNVLAARERLRLAEQNVLFNGVTAYMNVLRDAASLALQRNNVAVLIEQVKQGEERFREGQITRTDVLQSQSRLASGRSQLSLAQANLEASRASYRQVVGVEASQLQPASANFRNLPSSLESAILISQREHPAIQAALHGADVAQLEVRVIEGELYPTLSLVATATTSADTEARGDRQTSAAALARLTIPIYSGGATSARIRQAKELSGQRTLDSMQLREEVRAGVRSSWSALTAIREQIKAAREQISSAELALTGVREEARVGQRTTLDVLNAQQELLNARIALIIAQRDQVVASYALLGSVGRLSARTLELPVQSYDPSLHFDAVAKKWGGTRTPDGR